MNAKKINLILKVCFFNFGLTLLLGFLIFSGMKKHLQPELEAGTYSDMLKLASAFILGQFMIVAAGHAAWMAFETLRAFQAAGWSLKKMKDNSFNKK